MTVKHVLALALAVALFLACELSGRCSEKLVDHAYQLAMAIVVATFAHARSGSAEPDKSGKTTTA